jgi:hypothetical protein
VLIGAATGFVVGSVLSPSTPSVRAYETDEVKDVSNPSNLIITDATYYGITGEAGAGSGGGAGGSITYSYSGFTQPFTWWAVTSSGYSVYWDGQVVVNVSTSSGASVTSATGTDGYVYYRATNPSDILDTNALGLNLGIFYYYGVGRA